MFSGGTYKIITVLPRLASPVRIWLPTCSLIGGTQTHVLQHMLGVRAEHEQKLPSQENTAVHGCWSSHRVPPKHWESWWLLFHDHNWSHSPSCDCNHRAKNLPENSPVLQSSQSQPKSDAGGRCQEGSDPMGSVGTAPATPRNGAGSSEGDAQANQLIP